MTGDHSSFQKSEPTLIQPNSVLDDTSEGESETPLTFRRPKTVIPVPTPSAEFQSVQAGVPDSQLTREATGLLREFSTPLLFNHSHRVFF